MQSKKGTNYIGATSSWPNHGYGNSCSTNSSSSGSSMYSLLRNEKCTILRYFTTQTTQTLCKLSMKQEWKHLLDLNDKHIHLHNTTILYACMRACVHKHTSAIEKIAQSFMSYVILLWKRAHHKFHLNNTHTRIWNCERKMTTLWNEWNNRLNEGIVCDGKMEIFIW